MHTTSQTRSSSIHSTQRSAAAEPRPQHEIAQAHCTLPTRRSAANITHSAGARHLCPLWLQLLSREISNPHAGEHMTLRVPQTRTLLEARTYICISLRCTTAWMQAQGYTLNKPQTLLLSTTGRISGDIEAVGCLTQAARSRTSPHACIIHPAEQSTWPFATTTPYIPSMPPRAADLGPKQRCTCGHTAAECGTRPLLAGDWGEGGGSKVGSSERELR